MNDIILVADLLHHDWLQDWLYKIQVLDDEQLFSCILGHINSVAGANDMWGRNYAAATRHTARLLVHRCHTNATTTSS